LASVLVMSATPSPGVLEDPLMAEHRSSGVLFPDDVAARGFLFQLFQRS
jgi:hypothetical protein